MAKSSADLADKLYRCARAIPRANREAVFQAALFAKGEFVDGGVAAGLRKGGNLPSSGGRKWGAGFDVKGEENATALVRYRGPVQWAFGGTGKHIIAAKLLTTRSGARSRQARLGAGSAFGGRGANRGVFGPMQINVNYNRYGSQRQQAKSGRGLRRRAGKKALTGMGADGPRAYAFHPGSSGRNAWPIVKNRVRRGAPKVFPAAYRGAMLRAGLGRR